MKMDFFLLLIYVISASLLLDYEFLKDNDSFLQFLVLPTDSDLSKFIEYLLCASYHVKNSLYITSSNPHDKYMIAILLFNFLVSKHRLRQMK